VVALRVQSQHGGRNLAHLSQTQVSRDTTEMLALVKVRSTGAWCDALSRQGRVVQRAVHPKRLSGAYRSNFGRRHSLDQASTGLAGKLVQNSIGAVLLVRRRKTSPIPDPVSRFVCLTWGNIEKFVVVWSLVIGSRNCLEKLRWEADSMRRGVSRPMIRLCCSLCPVCDGPSHNPHTWGTRFPGNMPH